jgi:hypothetical protein
LQRIQDNDEGLSSVITERRVYDPIKKAAEPAVDKPGLTPSQGIPDEESKVKVFLQLQIDNVQ